MTFPPRMPNPGRDALLLIGMERVRQGELQRAGKFRWTLAASGITVAAKFVRLSEEVGEVARAICERDGIGLIREVTHVAACGAAWLEALSVHSPEWGNE
jgi:hypothetical protein